MLDSVFSKSEKVISKRRFIFAAYDRFLGDYVHLVTADSAGLAARSLLLSLKVPVKDCDLFCIGEYRSDIPTDLTTVPISCLKFKYYSSPKAYPWSVYHLPESVAEAMAPLGATPEEIEEREKFVKEGK